MQYIDSVVQSRITKAPCSSSGKNKLNQWGMCRDKGAASL